LTHNLQNLYGKIAGYSVSVLPDFFADRILYVPSIEKLFDDLQDKATSGGGSLRGYEQKEIKGGNATNLAFALSSLSLQTHLCIIGNDVARGFTAGHPKKCKVRVIEGNPGYTLAIEFPYNDKRVNVMVSDVGDLAEFAGEKLTSADCKSIAGSDCVALVNWSSNKKGNELAQLVFALPRRNRRLNFLDPADLTGAEDRVKVLVQSVIRKGLLDVLSVNENEARLLSEFLSISKLPLDYSAGEIKRVAMSLHKTLSTIIDIHTPLGCASATDGDVFWADSFGKVEGMVTGAGDAWDAGDIVGHLLKTSPDKRLQFANACAYLYLNDKEAEPPTVGEVVRFLKKKGISLS
jgi:ribokinase